MDWALLTIVALEALAFAWSQSRISNAYRIGYGNGQRDAALGIDVRDTWGQ